MNDVLPCRISETARNVFLTTILVLASLFIVNLVNEIYQDILRDDEPEIETFDERMKRYEAPDL